MPKQIDIKIETDKWQDYESALYEHIDYLWDALSLKNGEVSVLLSDDARLCALNKQYRGKDKPTNILSFPASDIVPDSQIPPYLVLGDMALSFQRLAEEAEQADITFHDRALHLITHGFLHLLGYRHHSPETATIMEGLEAKLLAPCGIADPYLIAESVLD